MQEADSALVVMGNHEYNAVAFHTAHDDRWLRSRSDVHLRQHLETLYQYRNHREEWTRTLEWIRTLPLYFENNLFRVVHAAWIPSLIESLRKNPAPLSSQGFLLRSATRGTTEYQLVEALLKGVEMKLPNGAVIHDKEGVPRSRTRIRWWLNPTDSTATYRELAMPPVETVPDDPLPLHVRSMVPGYDGKKPVFFGHYWLTGDPEPFTPFVACLDYSVARAGSLVAYRFEGESELRSDNYIAVHTRRNA